MELRRGDNPLAIERKKSRLEPGAAQKADDDKTRIAFFVPDEARSVLEEILRDYTTGQLTEKGRPPRKAFVDPIETIRQARLETFWTDDPQALPARPQDEIWWELWCSKGKEEQVRNAAEILNARVADARWSSAMPIAAKSISSIVARDARTGTTVTSGNRSHFSSLGKPYCAVELLLSVFFQEKGGRSTRA